MFNNIDCMDGSKEADVNRPENVKSFIHQDVFTGFPTDDDFDKKYSLIIGSQILGHFSPGY